MKNKWLNSFKDLLFPRLCVVCDTALSGTESYLCVNCLGNLPKTGFHLIPENDLEKRFWGKLDLERASAFFYYTKGSDFDKILYELKYRGLKELGKTMGRYMAAEIFPSGFFSGIDLIIPIPLHPEREKHRGYNQCDWIAMGISSFANIPICSTAVRRTVANPTQTHKSALERWENVQGIFKVIDPLPLEGKHILLVDDVLTTGATILSCASAMSEIKGIRFSILALATV